MTMFCKLEDLNNESDVEQKLLIPIITTQPPLGLGYLNSDYKTKSDLRQILIGKGSSEKLYYPDYIIVINGFPILIIEAKRPDEDVLTGINEARLYATELNKLLPHNINPCQKIISSNGRKIVAQLWDSAETGIEINFEDIFPGSVKYSKLIDFASKNNLSGSTEGLLNKLAKKPLFLNPLRIIGGRRVVNEELPENNFGSTLALDFQSIFNPQTHKDRIEIVRNAYVPSIKRQKHVAPIQKVIRAAILPSESKACLIEDTSEPNVVIEKLQSHKKLTGKILLFIGGAGSGKSTFIDYFRELCLPKELIDELVWVYMDFNEVALTKELIYNWMMERIIQDLENSYSEINFDKLATIEKLYSVELKKVKVGEASLFSEDSLEYRKIIADKISELKKDKLSTLRAHIRYLCKERGKSLIIILDNCDKRNRDDQLLMFEVAKWLQKECSCVIFLTIRDTTFDHHNNEPPLDTIVKDLAFRIDPPTIFNVINARVNYVLNKMQGKIPDRLEYDLAQGIRITYPKTDQAMHLACILYSLLRNDKLSRELLPGLAGRNMRKGIEIFLDFCKSGHIGTNEIYKIRQSEGKNPLPRHIVLRVLLRRSRKYYQDDVSLIKNLFHTTPEDLIPDPFIRLSILFWLKSMYSKHGPNGVRGFHKISTLISDLIPLGHSENRIRLELDVLIKNELIITESQDYIKYSDDDLISISPSGIMHIKLLSNIVYLAACAEDNWYKNKSVAEIISKRITGQIGRGHYSISTTILNAKDLLLYLKEYYNEVLFKPEVYLNAGKYIQAINFEEIIKNIEQQERSYSSEIEFENAIQTIIPGTIVECEVMAAKNYGIFVEFDEGRFRMQGFISKVNFEKSTSKSFLVAGNYDTGAKINAEIIDFNNEHKRFNLKVIKEKSQE